MSSSNPPHGSPGAPHLTYANPTASITPRRSSWAEVAAGSRPAYQLHLPRIASTSAHQYTATAEQPSRIPQPVADPDLQADGATNIPGTWGTGKGNMTYSNTRFSNQGYAGAGGGGEPLGFFIPSYLRQTRYAERLKAANEAELEAHCEETPIRSSNGGSLSTSSSSLSLQKMAPSHRGMTYEIIERQPEVDQNPRIPPLPSKWAEADKYGAIEISSDGLEAKYVGPSKVSDHEAASTRTDHPIPPQCGIYYYEIYIHAKGKEGMIALGFSGPSVSLEKLPGWEIDSWAYHGDDGKSFCQHSQGKLYGPTFSTGDIVGCGINFTTGCAFFTKNGVFQGNAFKDLTAANGKTIYPSIGMKRPNAQVNVNFGQAPFVFDIEDMVLRERMRLEAETVHADVSKIHTNLNKDDLCKALVAQYLSHDGYVETAKAFAGEVRSEATALHGCPDSKLENLLSVEEDHDAVNRQQIRTAIVNGDIDKAVKFTNAYYPHVLQDNPRIYFRLRCRKFIEMMRQSAELLDASSSKRTKATNGQSSTQSEDGFEPEMDVDDPEKDGDDWDRMSTEDTSDAKFSLQTTMVEYAKELKAEFKENRDKLVTESITNIFSMFGYEDPRKSPQGKLLDSSQRVPVAEALNSAILVSLGKASSTALERLYKQTAVLLDMTSEEGGPGSLINISNMIKPSNDRR